MNKKNCCENKGSQIKKGILYGILPHSFCIAFIFFSIIGATAFTTLLKPFMLNAYFFPLLVFLSFMLASVSAFIYLRKTCILSINSIVKNKNYLLTLYASVIGINLLLFLVVFPLLANSSFSNSNKNVSSINVETKTISVQIPCSGHAPLIMEEVSKLDGILSINYSPLYNFEIKYDPQKTSLEEILSLPIFKSFKAGVVNGR